MSEPDDLPEEYRLPARLPTVPPGYARPGELPHGYVPSYGGHRHWQPPPRPELPADTREALPKLWDEAKTVWNAMWLAFGNVAHTIAGDHIQPATHKLMGDWVRNAELLARRIILIASLMLELAPLKPVRPRSNPRRTQPAKARTPKPVTLDDPETWKTSFRFFPCAARASQPRRIRRATPSLRRVTARGYALRIEALRRVIRDRETYALRAARRFQRLAAANRTASQPRAIEVASWSCHPSDHTPGKHLIKETMRLAQPLVFRRHGRLESALCRARIGGLKHPNLLSYDPSEAPAGTAPRAGLPGAQRWVKKTFSINKLWGCGKPTQAFVSQRTNG